MEEGKVLKQRFLSFVPQHTPLYGHLSEVTKSFWGGRGSGWSGGLFHVCENRALGLCQHSGVNQHSYFCLWCCSLAAIWWVPADAVQASRNHLAYHWLRNAKLEHWEEQGLACLWVKGGSLWHAASSRLQEVLDWS